MPQKLWGERAIESSSGFRPSDHQAEIFVRFGKRDSRKLPEELAPFLEKARELGPHDQIDAVQELASRHYAEFYKSDTKTYGVPEYWATPAEFFENGAGDCEDIAFVSFALLRALDWRDESLALVAVVLDTGVPHVALVAFLDGKAFVVDGQSGGNTALSASAIPHSPEYGMNEAGWWDYTDTPQYKKSSAR